MKHLSENIRVPIELDNLSIMRDEKLCIKCGQCKDICGKFVGIHGTYKLKDTNNIAVCINCGQCANVCPTSSITEKYEYQILKNIISDPEKIFIFSTSPSVRVAIGEEFGKEDGEFLQGKMISLICTLSSTQFNYQHFFL
jgi:NADH dehydrogenase/NADH:ubiquinone oxidoreductase subunit G